MTRKRRKKHQDSRFYSDKFFKVKDVLDRANLIVLSLMIDGKIRTREEIRKALEKDMHHDLVDDALQYLEKIYHAIERWNYEDGAIGAWRFQITELFRDRETQEQYFPMLYTHGFTVEQFLEEFNKKE